jgi:short-subunit dehydrogenase
MSTETPRRTVLVTGASAGIGAALARVFAQEGFDVVLTARRADRLEALASELRAAHGSAVHVVVANLADPDAPRQIFENVTRAGIHVDALVNNAGYGLAGSFAGLPWPAHRDFIQVLITAVVELTYRFLPGMTNRRQGWIINVSSVAGMVPQTAGHTLYGASKALVLKFSEALAAEVARDGINVTALCPGFTYSEFHDVNGMRPSVSRFPRWVWLQADEVARLGYRAVTRGQVVCVTGWVYRALLQAVRFAPQWLFRIVGRRVARSYRQV